MAAWFAGTFWPGVWPNLAADLIWIPVSFSAGFASAHLAVWWHMRGLHARLDRHGVPR